MKLIFFIVKFKEKISFYSFNAYSHSGFINFDSILEHTCFNPLVIGGYDGTRDLNTVERFDPRIGSWCNVAPMPTHRASLAASIFDGKIYAAGGFDGNSALRIVEMFNKIGGKNNNFLPR